MCSYTFRPNINGRRRASSSDAASRTPIHLRTEAIRKQRQDQVRAAQAAESTRSQCSFQPRISERSERIVQRRRDMDYRKASQGDESCLKKLGPVEDRLYAEAQALERKRAERLEAQSEPSVSAPSVDEGSKRICKSSVYFQGAQQDFLTRQQTFEMAKQKRMELRTQRVDAECSFRPEISDVSRQIVSSNLEYLGETSDERVERLAIRDVERRDRLRGALEQLHQRDCTFRPAVNPMSQLIAARAEDQQMMHGGQRMEVYERLYQGALDRSRDNSQMSVGEGHSFRPQVEQKKRFAHIKSHYGPKDGIMENIREELAQREELLEERRREREDQEQAECTFAPETRSRAFEEPARPVAVSGLGRFFELRGLAQRQKREQEEREARVFQPQPTGLRCAGVTIPEPFDLSAGPADGSRARARLEQTAEDQECTFMPSTNEGVNRELLQRILDASC
eukprot:TRINITY_DN26238_c0_g1_i2.p1 TRINITY_DN26238_c0_g1~~TRINITY_DN26238_c0_g1_i2.p1  ORF type:complete len:453 (-),score=76.70 TRINITY_DN26238_c0_g1_i2:36-1394(-)